MNPIMISFGNFDIRWYSFFVLIAAISVLVLTEREAKRFNIRKDFIFNMLFWCLIFGVIGARLYYVIFNFEAFRSNPIEILEVWNGGLAIHGGLIAGLITALLYCKKYNVRTIRILDFATVPLLLAQAIGRWGNFFNQEAHGAATTVLRLKSLLVPDFIINGMNIDGVTYIPTFYFESIACLAVFIILLFVRRGKYIKVGQMTALYLISYGVIRFLIETSRTDALMLGGFKVAQIVSILMIIVGIGITMFLSRRGKFEDLYNDTNNVDEIKF